MPRQKIVLVDGHSLAYRAYHALPPDLQSTKGELTNASFGFTSMLMGVLEEEKPTHVVVTFDKGPSFRVRDYAEYKAHREKMPGEMRGQMERIRDLVDAFGIPIVEVEDYEADDVLGTLACQAEEQGMQVVIVTGDRDALQLVTDHVMVLTSGRRFSETLRFTPDKVRQRYDLEPEQLVDYKALIGDKSDNIPGVYGVGEKGATRLLKKYGDLDEIYAHLEEHSTRYRNALEKGREDAFMSRRLGRIICDVPVELDVQAARWGQGADQERVLALMQEMEFRSLLNRLPLLFGTAHAAGQQLSLFPETEDTEEAMALQEEGDYHRVVSEDALQRLVERLSQAEVIALDTETTDVDPMVADLVGISLSDRVGEAWYVPVRAPAGERTLPLAEVRRQLQPVFADPAIAKRGHNLKYDLKVLQRHGFEVAGPLFDSMVAEWIVNPDASLSLKNQAWVRLGIQMTEIKELIGSGRGQKTMDQVALAKVSDYACADADMTYRLAEILEGELDARDQRELFEELEMPLLPVLLAMELRGIRLDVDWLATLSQEMNERLAELESGIYQHAGGPFNVNSTQQLSDVLFETLGLNKRYTNKTKSGYYSTRAEVLEKLRGEHPIIDALLEYRELAKLQSTYVDALPQLVHPETGRVHTSYNPTGTVTGRISSTNPNLQNIPIRSAEGRRVRRAFIADEGWVLIGADYSQVELRVMAHVSQDEGLLAAFRRGEDVHATTAAAIYDVPLSEVTYDMRRVGKGVNFGLIYGQSAYGLANQLGLKVEEAQTFIDRYFERFPGVRISMDRVLTEATSEGYVETLLRRRRYFPKLVRGQRVSVRQRRAMQRMAINTPIQGTAADIIKLAMIRLHRMLRERGLDAHMLLQVHDEIVLEAPEAQAEATVAVVREAMEDAFTLDVPLHVDVAVGHNWQEMKE